MRFLTDTFSNIVVTNVSRDLEMNVQDLPYPSWREWRDHYHAFTPWASQVTVSHSYGSEKQVTRSDKFSRKKYKSKGIQIIPISQPVVHVHCTYSKIAIPLVLGFCDTSFFLWSRIPRNPARNLVVIPIYISSISSNRTMSAQKNNCQSIIFFFVFVFRLFS